MFWFIKCKNQKIFVWFSGWTHLKAERTTALCVKLNTWVCRGITLTNIWSESPICGKRKSGVFFADSLGFEVSFLEISVPARTWCNHNIVHVQVTIFVTCLNFVGTGSRISLPAVSSCRRVKPSRKIALNSNGEVNCRELARRPWGYLHYTIPQNKNVWQSWHASTWQTYVGPFLLENKYNHSHYLLHEVWKCYRWILPGSPNCLLFSNTARSVIVLYSHLNKAFWLPWGVPNMMRYFSKMWYKFWEDFKQGHTFMNGIIAQNMC